MNLFFKEFGNPNGTPVIFIHGYPLHHEMWKPQMEALTDIRGIVYDTRGLGKSPVGDGQYTLDTHVDDLKELIEHLNLESVVLCGLSMGGYIALRMMERFPQKISGLILADTKSASDTDEIKIGRYASFKKIKLRGLETFNPDYLKGLLAPQTFETQPKLVNEVVRILKGNNPIGICGVLLALAARTDATANLVKIKIPTLILVGEHDQTTPVSDAKILNERIKGSTLQIIPNAAHLSNLENSEVFNEAISRFLQSIAL